MPTPYRRLYQAVPKYSGRFYRSLNFGGPLGFATDVLILIVLPTAVFSVAMFLGLSEFATELMIITFVLLLLHFLSKLERWMRSKPQRDLKHRLNNGNGILVLLVAVVSVSGLALAVPNTAQARTMDSEWDFGGINTTRDAIRGAGCMTADVWHSGHHPLAYLGYRFHLRVEACGNGARFTKLNVRGFSTNEAPTTTVKGDQGVIGADQKFYNCRVNGRWRRNGCFYAMYKGSFTHNAVPVLGNLISINAYPWVTVRVNAAGEVVVWNYSKGKG